MIDSNLEEVIAEFIKNKDVKLASSKIAKVIENGQEFLLLLVEGLGLLLASQDTGDRIVSVQLLAEVVHLLPRSGLKADQLSHFVVFMVERMRDHHTVLPGVLHAATALIQQENMTEGDVERLMRGLFLEVHCQSQLTADRRNIYTIIRLFITLHPKVVASMLDELVYGFVSSCDGEKDPRNLLLVFSVVPLLVSLQNSASMTEDLFEVVAAYFPIDFVPPVHDPYGVTTEDLVLGLRQCFASSSAWAEYLLPLLIEKMQSDLPSAKTDAYNTLTSCCPLYSCPAVAPHLREVWACVRRDVVVEEAPSDPQVSRAALLALTAVVAVLYRGHVDLHNVQDWLRVTVDECSVHLSAPESLLWLPACSLLTSIIMADWQASRLVADKVLPSMCRQLIELSSKSNNTATANTVTALEKFLVAAGHIDQAHVIKSGVSNPSVVSSHETACLEAVTAALHSTSPAVLSAAVQAAHAVFYSGQQQHWHHLLQHITTVLLSPAGQHDSVREKCVSALSSPSVHSSELLSSVLLLALDREEKPPITGSEASKSWAERDGGVVLSAVVAATRGRGAVALLLQHLWPLLQLRPATRLVRALAQVTTNNKDVEEVQELLFVQWEGLDRVSALALSACHTSAGGGSSGSVQLLSAFSCLVRAMANLSKDSSDCAILKAKQLLLSESATEDPTVLVYLLEGLLCCARDVSGVCEDTSLLQSVVNWALQPSLCTHTRTAAALTLATVVNKTPAAGLGPVLSFLQPRLRDAVSASQPSEQRAAAVAVWGWLTKALEMRAAPEARQWMDTLQSLLCDPVVGVATAQCYSLLLADHPYALNTSSHANVRLLYKQRVFQRIIGGLVEQFESSQGSTRHCSLLAIATLLTDLPQHLVQQHMHKLVPVLVEGVRCGSAAAVVRGSITTLRQLLEAEEPAAELAPHAPAIIAALLSLAAANAHHNNSKRKTLGYTDAQSQAVQQPQCCARVQQQETKNAGGGACCRRRNGGDKGPKLQEIVKGSTEEPDPASMQVDEHKSISSDNSSNNSSNKQATTLEPSSEFSSSLESKCKMSDSSSQSSVGWCARKLPDHQPVAVREGSLKCLELLTKLPLEYILPYREEVIRGVQAAIGEHKRVVRRAAGDARCAWMLLAAS